MARCRAQGLDQRQRPCKARQDARQQAARSATCRATLRPWLLGPGVPDLGCGGIPERRSDEVNGTPQSSAAKLFKSPRVTALTRSAGKVAVLTISYPRLGLRLQLRPQGSSTLTVPQIVVTKPAFVIGHVRVGMTQLQARKAAGQTTPCAASSCRWRTAAGIAVARLKTGKVVSVVVTAPPVQPVMPPPGSTTSPITLPATTHVIPDADVSSAAGNAGGPTTLKLAPGPAASLSPGDIIALGITAATPEGLLGEITSVSASPPGVMVHTVPATLLDALPQGTIKVEQQTFNDRMNSLGEQSGTHASFGSTYGTGWWREDSALTLGGTGAFCYSFNPHGMHPAGNGTRYRITVIGPGVTPDIGWDGTSPGAFNAIRDSFANAQEQQLHDKIRKAN